MSLLRAIYRTFLLALIVFTGTLGLLLVGWWRLEVRGARLSVWLLHLMCRLSLRVLRLDVTISNPALARAHMGFFFANHCSYMDILLMASLTPVRFVAKREVTQIPFVGYVAKAAGCVFVDRQNPASRRAIGQQLTDMAHFPPIVLFPEGTRNDGGHLLPFRRGAFKIAVQGGISFVPVAIVYEAPRWFVWDKTRLIPWREMWRLVGRAEPLRVTLALLGRVDPTAESEANQLMVETHAALRERLQRRE